MSLGLLLFLLKIQWFFTLWPTEPIRGSIPGEVLMSQEKVVKERVYCHWLCEVVALAKWETPVDGKTLMCPQINRCWKSFVNHWQSFPRSKCAVSCSFF